MKLSLEQLLVPLIVSFFMSGINSASAHLSQYDFIWSEFLFDWAMHWALAYPCLLLLVPFARHTVQKLMLK